MNKPLKYIKGRNWAICDRCGHIFRADELKREWTGALVCKDDWEPRHPQESVRGRKENVIPPVVNPEPTDTTVDVTFADTGADDIPEGTFDNSL